MNIKKMRGEDRRREGRMGRDHGEVVVHVLHHEDFLLELGDEVEGGPRGDTVDNQEALATVYVLLSRKRP